MLSSIATAVNPHEVHARAYGAFTNRSYRHVSQDSKGGWNVMIVAVSWSPASALGVELNDTHSSGLVSLDKMQLPHASSPRPLRQCIFCGCSPGLVLMWPLTFETPLTCYVLSVANRMPNIIWVEQSHAAMSSQETPHR